MSDVDLTQYDGTPAFPDTADVGTTADTYLVPTDGKIVTATSNLPDEAPVNRALERGKDLIIGLRGATLGDFAGAQPRTFQSLQVDGAGGAPTSLLPGDIEAAQSIQALNGGITSKIGFYARQGYLRCDKSPTPFDESYFADWAKAYYLNTSTAADGSNPPRGTSVRNQYRAKNAIKYWGRISASLGVITLKTGWGNWDAAPFDAGSGVLPRYRVLVTLNDAMADFFYIVHAQWHLDTAGQDIYEVRPLGITLNRNNFQLAILSATFPGPAYANLDTTSQTWDIGFSVLGVQNT